MVKMHKLRILISKIVFLYKIFILGMFLLEMLILRIFFK